MKAANAEGVIQYIDAGTKGVGVEELIVHGWCLFGAWHIGLNLNCCLKVLSAQQCSRKWKT